MSPCILHHNEAKLVSHSSKEAAVIAFHSLISYFCVTLYVCPDEAKSVSHSRRQLLLLPLLNLIFFVSPCMFVLMRPSQSVSHSRRQLLLAAVLLLTNVYISSVIITFLSPTADFELFKLSSAYWYLHIFTHTWSANLGLHLYRVVLLCTSSILSTQSEFSIFFLITCPIWQI